MTIPRILTDLESGKISSDQALGLIVSEINRIRNINPYEGMSRQSDYLLCWKGAFDTLKASMGVLKEEEV